MCKLHNTKYQNFGKHNKEKGQEFLMRYLSQSDKCDRVLTRTHENIFTKILEGNTCDDHVTIGDINCTL